MHALIRSILSLCALLAAGFVSTQVAFGSETSTSFPSSWAKVPMNLHFAKRGGNLTNAEIDFVAKNANFVTLEKGHGVGAHGSTEAGIADTARRIKARNPNVKVLFYLNTFINYSGYEANKTYKSEWTLLDTKGNVVTHPKMNLSRPDPSNPEFREWWSDIVAKACREAPIDGLYADAVPQATTVGLKRRVGAAKAAAVVNGVAEMLALTKKKMGRDHIVLVNAPRQPDQFDLVLNWKGVDGIMIEHFDAFLATKPADLKADLDALTTAASKGKFCILKAWPGFTWMDKDVMRLPHRELLKRAKANITFPLAAFLVAAQPGSYFCYSWGYVHNHGMLETYPELGRPLGPPKADAVWDGLTATREFAHASVQLDLNTKKAQITWR